jgi:hypothetical protein
MKKRNIIYVVILLVMFILPNVTAKQEASDIPSDWIDIGSGKIHGWITIDEIYYDCYTWRDVSIGFPFFWFLSEPNGIISTARIGRLHFLLPGKIFWEHREGPIGDMKVDGTNYNTFWITGFTGIWTTLIITNEGGGGASLRVMGNALHVWIPPS